MTWCAWPVTTDVKSVPLTATDHLDGVDGELVVDHLHLLGGLDDDGAGRDPVEVVVGDDELVCVHDLQPRQRDVSEPVLVQDQFLHPVRVYLK